MYGQQPQYQYSIDQFQVPRVQIDVNRPPVSFRNAIQCAPWIAQNLDFLTGIMADVISANVAGPVSMHFYNNMSKNNWANDDFAREVHNCADFIFLKANGAQDPNLFGRFAPVYLDLRSKFEINIQGFSYLRPLINPQDLPMFDQASALFNQEMQAILSMRQNGLRQAAPAPAYSTQGNYPPPVQAAPYASQAPAPAYQSNNYGAPAGGRSSGAGRDYGTPAQQQAPVQPQVQQAQVQQQVQAAPPGMVQPAAAPGAPMIVEMDAAKWNPPPEFPYPMMYNPVSVKLMYEIDAQGYTKFHPTRTDMEQIDFDRHNIQTFFGRPPENMKVVKDNGPLVASIKQAADDALAETLNVDETGERIEEYMGMRNVISAFNLDTAIMDLRTEMWAKVDRAEMPLVFQADAQIFTAIIGNETEYDLVRKLGSCSSYLALREELVAIGDKASPALLTDITMKLTSLMNELLRTRLSIPPEDLEVEDFSRDLEVLFGILKNNYGANGERMYKAFIKDQALRIQAMFQTPDMQAESGQRLHNSLTEMSLTESWRDPEDGDKFRDDAPKFTFFGPVLRITFLNAVSHDLLVQASMPGVGNVLSKVHSFVLYNLGETLFKVDNKSPLIDRQLVVTLDGRIMEIYLGALMDPPTLMVQLVK